MSAVGKTKKKKPLHVKKMPETLQNVPAGKIRVILRRSIGKLGMIGEFVDVAPGYFRNFLLPKKFALLATPQNVKVVETEKLKILSEEKKLKEDMLLVKEKLLTADVTLRMKAQETGTLYAMVRPEHIAQVLKEEGILISASMIEIHIPIKEVGHHAVVYNLHPEISFEGKVWVVEE